MKINIKNDVTLQPVHTHTHTHTHTHGTIKRKLIKVIVFLLILIICFEVVYNVTKRKYSYKKMADFFSQEENFEVLFFGSSHMLNGVYPMQLWDDYGIVSYNLGNHSERIVASYYNMLLALQETKPKLVVIDIFLLGENSKYEKNKTEYVYNLLDSYPMSYIKYLAIKDIFNGEDLLDNEFEYLFNFSMYHSRWDELKAEDFYKANEYEKGANTRINVATPQDTSNFEDIDIYSGEETVNMEYLRKMIEYCQETNIEILVVNLPYLALDKNIAYSKYAQVICDEYDVNYINFLNMDIVNYNTDMYDTSSHLNSSGARKVTEYLGQYIMENYDIQDQRENEAYSFWYEDYDEYINLKISNLKDNSKNLNNYLMLLYGEEDIGYEIKISSTKEITEGGTLQQLLENIGNNYTIDDEAFAEKTDKTIKITTYDNRTGEEIQTIYF